MMTLGEAAAVLGGTTAAGQVRFEAVSTDSRALREGELFVALRGERFDGHEFLAMAAGRGAAGAMVERRHGGPLPLPALLVEDTRRALGELARHWRRRFSPSVVAVTGSNGKTTVKEMLAAILRHHAKAEAAGEVAVLATSGNLNNDIGVPLMVLRLRAEHRWCAFELGMNHPGEIAYLAGIAAPTVALVNNAQREHLEFRSSVDQVAAENGSVYDALPADGVAVVNADDAHAGYFRARAEPRRVVDFGLRGAQVTGRYELKHLASEIRIRTPDGEAEASLAIPGLHNVRNALAAAACAVAAGIPAASVGAGLRAFRPYTGRLQVKQGTGGVTIIDDTYNANPDSVRAAIDVLVSCPGPTALVLGDMGEVGEQGPQFHREVGEYARSKGVDRLLALGAATPDAVSAFGPGASHFAAVEELVAALAAKTVLVKGSRFMKMERVVAALTGTRDPGGH
ncbi:MAG TPA: UDP-N-acetylmuramoyl-tripeptide--D-alanyl-D-alanine ligase [Burkholderiales bacterium]|nr:UDP-N-acetylmuramoyl-tripeptide--D-alanyl-D-alanine ligase [Burkholderiales bacterium]